MQKIIVIGGSRFVGPALIQKLSAGNFDITVLNRGLIHYDYPAGVRFIKGDRNTGFNIQEHFDIVIDMCAYTGAHTKRELEELRFNFFVHMSTAAVYKKTEIFPLTEMSPVGDWPIWGEYGRGKVSIERYLESADINYATIRPVYILGPRNYVQREKFIYNAIKK